MTHLRDERRGRRPHRLTTDHSDQPVEHRHDPLGVRGTQYGVASLLGRQVGRVSRGPERPAAALRSDG